MRKDKNGFTELPEFCKIDLQKAFDHDRHSDDGCPLRIDVEEDLDRLTAEVDLELQKIIAL